MVPYLISIKKLTLPFFLIKLSFNQAFERDYKLNIDTGFISLADLQKRITIQGKDKTSSFGVIARLFIRNEVLPILIKYRDDKSYNELVKIFLYLKNSANNIFNQENTPVSVRIIAQDLNITESDTAALCHKLYETIPLVEEHRIGGKYPFYRIKVN